MQGSKAMGVLLFLMSCSSPEAQSDLFEPGRELGTNENPHLEETSGLAASIRYTGRYWALNDGGHPAEIFLLDSSGQTTGTFRFPGLRNRDWEDIAVGSGRDNVPMIFIGEIGDNHQRHGYKYIYCVPEPDLTETQLTVKDTLVVHMDDRPRDSEALLFDPLTRNLYIVTKMEKNVRVYEIPYTKDADTVSVKPVLELPVRFITAGDISRDGSEILLKNYTSIYYWKRGEKQSVMDALRQEPIELSYEREPQGESIAWSAEGSGFFTLSENGKGERGRMLYYARTRKSATTTQP